MRTERWSGLDGLRALAVIAVVLFHFAPGLLPGGFLGVDIFFAISGYLITRMLVEQVNDRGRIDVRAFYLRRARRLFPALGALLVGAACAALVWRDQLTTVRQAVLAAALYVSNWWQAYSHQPYFVQTGRPGLLQHLWSLAIEEQFYLVWPAVVGLVLAHGSVRRLAAVAGVLALGSTAAMTVLAVLRDVPFHDDGSRLYYGTDTHSAGLLVGAALGALATLRTRPAGRRTDLLGLVALGLLIRMLFVTDQFSTELYRGGFLVAGVLATTAIATAALPGSRLGRVLDVVPMRAIGRRSYAIYLWHWPVADVTRPGLDLSWPVPLVFALRVAVTLVLAEATYRWVEQPIRRHGFLPTVRAGIARVRRSRAGDGNARWVGALVTMVLIAAGLVLLGAPRAPESQAAQTASGVGGRSLSLGGGPRGSSRPAGTGGTGAAGRHGSAGTTGGAAASTAPSTGPTTSSIPGRPAPAGPAATAPAATAPAATTPAATTSTAATPAATTSTASASASSPPAAPGAAPPGVSPSSASASASGAAASGTSAPAPAPLVGPSARRLPRLSGFGDSVLLGARSALGQVFPGGSLDAIEGRQAGPVLADVRSRAAAGTLAPVVLIHVGDNGLIDPADLRATLRALVHVPRVLVATVRVDREWQDPVNATIRAVVPQFANARIVDWHDHSAGHAAWFYGDGLHLDPEGATAYAHFIARAVFRR